MTAGADPYADIKRCVLPAQTAIAVQRVVPPKIRKRRAQFIKVPWVWAERLFTARRASTLKVALYILHQHWKRHGQPFRLANGAMAMDGIDRHRKRAALEELEQLSLITVERRQRKSPVVTVVI
jgi:hypothetical protein